MELVDGPTLDDRLADGPLEWLTAVRICAEVTAGLAAAHARGLVHRDVKPANVILAASGAKLVDFGIAAVAGERADLSADGFVYGTPAYLAPERIAGGLVTPASDVYAVGLLLYRALTGRLPWAVETITEMVRAHCHVEPAPMPRVPGLPAHVVELGARCLAKQPELRPTSFEVAKVLAVAGGIAVPSPRRYPKGVPPPSSGAGGLADPTEAAPGADADASAGVTAILPAGAATDQPGSTAAHGAEPDPAGRGGPGAPADPPLLVRAGQRRGVLVRAGVVLAASAAVVAVVYPRLTGPAGRSEGAAAGPPVGSPPPPACAVRYLTRTDAGGAFAVDLVVTNTRTEPVPGWLVEFAFPADQRLVGTDNATWSQSGRTVTLQPATGDGALRPGSPASLRLTGSYRSGNPLPTAFSLNGTPCAAEVAGASSATGTPPAGEAGTVPVTGGTTRTGAATGTTQGGTTQGGTAAGGAAGAGATVPPPTSQPSSSDDKSKGHGNGQGSGHGKKKK
jgi:serine/threonine-protein kinase